MITINGMDIEKFLELNKRGLIPGPEESEEDFEERAAYCLGLKDHLKSALKEKIPFSTEEASLDLSEEELEKSFGQYGIRPDWVPVFYSNVQLTPWHGGCAWIFQMDESSPTSAFLQLRRSFFHSDKYLGLLKKDEVISHELAHVGRMRFEEPKFEELLAYRSSCNGWRRWLGPLVQSTWESLLFVFLLLMIFIVDLFLFWYGDYEGYLRLVWLKMIPLGLVLAGVFRLTLRQRQLKKCVHALSKLIPSTFEVNAVLYRLTDREIIAFGSMDKNSLIDYIKEKEKSTLRWRVIAKEYFHERVHGKTT